MTRPSAEPPPVRLSDHDLVVISVSAGKDSQAMLIRVVEQADAEGYPRANLVVVHADMGRVEWPGTIEAARDHAAAFGLRFEVVAREQGDLLDHVRDRRDRLDATARELWAKAEQLRADGQHEQAEQVAAAGQRKWDAPAWPGPGNARWCTSDHKTAQIQKLITRLAREWRAEHPEEDRPFRVLQAMGMRAEESADRAAAPPVRRNPRSNGRKEITDWRPIHEWLVGQVWDTIHASGILHHYAYDLGAERVGCVLCFYKPRAELAAAVLHNPELAQQYLDTEQYARSTFKNGLSIAEVITDAKRLATTHPPALPPESRTGIAPSALPWNRVTDCLPAR